MSDLVAFLNARLGEDEVAALRAQEAAPEQSGHWHSAYARDDLDPSDWLIATVPLSFTPVAGPGLNQATAAHIARHDPARVLREVEAKRKILAEIVPAMDRMEDQIDAEWGTGHDPLVESVALLRIMTAVYGDHPDFDPTWA
jgi:hypothetical protein